MSRILYKCTPVMATGSSGAPSTFEPALTPCFQSRQEATLNPREKQAQVPTIGMDEVICTLYIYKDRPMDVLQTRQNGARPLSNCLPIFLSAYIYTYVCSNTRTHRMSRKGLGFAVVGLEPGLKAPGQYEVQRRKSLPRCVLNPAREPKILNLKAQSPSPRQEDP